jgi:hypothetical protein
MQLSNSRFGCNNMKLQFIEDGEIYIIPVYYYEAQYALFDVVVSPVSGRFLYRKDEGEWSRYAIDPIHLAVISHYELSEERVAV